MRWVILGGGIVFLSVALAALVGALLPVKHLASRKARFRQPPEIIYAVLAGPPTWRSDVKASGVLAESNGCKRWWEQDSHGQKITYELVEELAPVRRIVRIADPSLPFGGTWTTEITPQADSGSEVRITEAGEVYNIFFRVASRFVFGHTRTIEAYLRDLGTKLGEHVDIEA